MLVSSSATKIAIEIARAGEQHHAGRGDEDEREELTLPLAELLDVVERRQDDGA